MQTLRPIFQPALPVYSRAEQEPVTVKNYDEGAALPKSCLFIFYSGSSSGQRDVFIFKLAVQHKANPGHRQRLSYPSPFVAFLSDGPGNVEHNKPSCDLNS